jgi:hypothetical protein
VKELIADIGRLPLVLGTAAGTAAVGGISGESIHTISVVSAFAVAIITGFVWWDARWEKKLKEHAEEETLMDEERYEKLLLEFQKMLAEHRAADAEKRLEERG